MGAKTLIAWSSGKDGASALHALRRRADVDVVGLFCTVDEQSDRVAMHGVRADLLRLQAERVGLPIHLIAIPDPCNRVQYHARMSAFVADAGTCGTGCFAGIGCDLRDRCLGRYIDLPLQSPNNIFVTLRESGSWSSGHGPRSGPEGSVGGGIGPRIGAEPVMDRLQRRAVI